MSDVVDDKLSKPETPGGLFEAASRLLREFLRTPRCRELVHLFLRELDPPNAPLLIRVVAHEDPEIFMSLLAATPAAVNAVIGIWRELTATLMQYPPEMVASFGARMLSEIDAKQFGAAAAEGLLIRQRMLKSPGAEEDATTIAEKFATGFKERIADGGVEAEAIVEELLRSIGRSGKAMVEKLDRELQDPDSLTTKLAREAAPAVRSLLRENPAFVREILRPLAAALREME